MLDIKDIKTFNWKDIDGKTVRVSVTESEGVRVVGLYDTNDHMLYFVEVTQIGEQK